MVALEPFGYLAIPRDNAGVIVMCPQEQSASDFADESNQLRRIDHVIQNTGGKYRIQARRRVAQILDKVPTQEVGSRQFQDFLDNQALEVSTGVRFNRDD